MSKVKYQEMGNPINPQAKPRQDRHEDSFVMYSSSSEEITQAELDSLNIEQSRHVNREHLEAMGGIEMLCKRLGVDITKGLTSDQVYDKYLKFGNNVFPESPMSSFFELFAECFEDVIIIILMVAAIISLSIGMWEDPRTGWIEGTAILIAVLLVAFVTAGNNYSKELQFRALEKSSQADEAVSVLRNGEIERVNPADIVVGDVLVLQAGDSIPADAVIVTPGVVASNESALTGEADDLKKCAEKDCFLLSSCLITEADDKAMAVVIGIGLYSQWGKIKANLVSESVNTPLQDKLEEMAGLIGYIGAGAATGTFIAMVASIWLRHHGENVLDGFVEAFIIAVTIIVVAIPEGLPLAVTISLAYSTKKMYEDQNFIRILAACETMGNATNLCSDKTGTLTENRMTVVEAFIANKKYSEVEFDQCNAISSVKELIAENCCLNRTAYLIYVDSSGRPLHRPNVIGNKTEGALVIMAKGWGYDYENVRQQMFNEKTDRVFSFNSAKKRSTAVVHLRNGRVRLYVKGAPEWVLADCTNYLLQDGTCGIMTAAKKNEIEEHLNIMANNARRTLILAHKDFASVNQLPSNWQDNPPDNSGLCCDCVVGIIDPLRDDVQEAVRLAQQAGVTVRMVTGDNLNTACAIAKQCGILQPNGMALEGPVFRTMTPAQVDAILPRLQVLARSSPDDKYLLVTRLNGYAIPADQMEWEIKHKDKVGVSWLTHRDKLLPGYREEWEATRPYGGHVVGVTGDGTNDAPALKAADVGLAMGITGTKVAQSASDIVILDDKFSSIVRAIMWGRSVYDNIRKFLQFQLTVNVVALTIVFVGAVAGFDPPLNAVMMLWVNLIMDTMGALALGTEPPSLELLNRRPYKRTANLVSRPMWRNIFFQSVFQIILLLWMLFKGAEFFNVPNGDWCSSYFNVNHDSPYSWDPKSGERSDNGKQYSVTCKLFSQYCDDHSGNCFDAVHVSPDNSKTDFSFADMDHFAESCMECYAYEYVHTTLIFNAFVFGQIFNEFNARSIFDEVNIFKGLSSNPIFLGVIALTTILQFCIVTFGGEFTRTSPLTEDQWLTTIGFGLISLPVGFIMRFFPVKESDDDFFYDEISMDSSRRSRESYDRAFVDNSSHALISKL